MSDILLCKRGGWCDTRVEEYFAWLGAPDLTHNNVSLHTSFRTMKVTASFERG